MRPIQMVDLQLQYEQIKPEVSRVIQEVLDSCAFINGPQVSGFASALASYQGSEFIIPCANGTDALQIALMGLGLQPGDEVITPSFTFIATTEVIALLQLKPVFVDVDRDTFCIDSKLIRAAISNKTKAILPVHLYGQAANMEEILEIAKEFNLPVIEDNAQAIGADYTFKDGSSKKTGAIGTIGCTSFFPSKNLGAYGDGGAISTNDAELAHRMKMIVNHGQSERYYHDIVGCNSRLDSIQAAILGVKLKRLDEYIAARQRVAGFYNEAFGNISGVFTPKPAGFTSHVYHQYTLVLDGHDRNELQKYLAAQHVPSMIYYPVPAHRQKMFDDLGGGAFNLPVTDWLTQRVISLPIHTEMSDEQLAYMKDHVLKFLK